MVTVQGSNMHGKKDCIIYKNLSFFEQGTMSIISKRIVTRRIDSLAHKNKARLMIYESISASGQTKCPLSVLTGVPIKRVHFRENIRAFCRDKRNCLL